jgi:hypothetical protein
MSDGPKRPTRLTSKETRVITSGLAWCAFYQAAEPRAETVAHRPVEARCDTGFALFLFR